MFIANEIKIFSDSFHHNIKLLFILLAAGVVNHSLSATPITTEIIVVVNKLIQIRGVKRSIVIVLYSIVLSLGIFYLAPGKITFYLKNREPRPTSILQSRQTRLWEEQVQVLS